MEFKQLAKEDYDKQTALAKQAARLVADENYKREMEVASQLAEAFKAKFGVSPAFTVVPIDATKTAFYPVVVVPDTDNEFVTLNGDGWIEVYPNDDGSYSRLIDIEPMKTLADFYEQFFWEQNNG